MTTRPQPGAADHGSPDIVAVVAWLRLPGVHRDTDREPRQVCLEASLGSRGCLHGIGDTGEHADHTVALTLLDRTQAAKLSDGIAENLVVAQNRVGHLVGSFFPQPGRTLDISEQERHRSRRQRETNVLHTVSLHENGTGDDRREKGPRRRRPYRPQRGTSTRRGHPHQPSPGRTLTAPHVVVR